MKPESGLNAALKKSDLRQKSDLGNRNFVSSDSTIRVAKSGSACLLDYLESVTELTTTFGTPSQVGIKGKGGYSHSRSYVSLQVVGLIHGVGWDYSEEVSSV